MKNLVSPEVWYQIFWIVYAIFMLVAAYFIIKFAIIAALTEYGRK